MSANCLSLCRSLLLPPSIFPSIRVFSNESVPPIRWPKYWSFSFSISPSNEYSALISYRTDWLDLLAVQGMLKSLLQHHSSKASILWHPVFFFILSDKIESRDDFSSGQWKCGPGILSCLESVIFILYSGKSLASTEVSKERRLGEDKMWRLSLKEILSFKLLS